MRVRFLSERRMPSIWLTRILIPAVLVLIGGLRWAVPVGLKHFSKLEIKPGYYVNDSTNAASAVNPALALVSTSTQGL